MRRPRMPQMVFTKPVTPRTSWWVVSSDAEFTARQRDQAPRWKQDSRATGTEKVIGTHYGKI